LICPSKTIWEFRWPLRVFFEKETKLLLGIVVPALAGFLALFPPGNAFDQLRRRQHGGLSMGFNLFTLLFAQFEILRSLSTFDHGTPPAVSAYYI